MQAANKNVIFGPAWVNKINNGQFQNDKLGGYLPPNLVTAVAAISRYS